MSASSDETVPLASMALLLETDVVLCRNRARMLAETLGFDRQQQVRIATAVSEIARNAFRYAKGANASFSLNTAMAIPKRQGLLTVIADRGAGIADLDSVLSGNYRSRTGMGAGIRGAKRLMDRLEIQSSSSGTVVTMLQNLPPGAVVKSGALQQISDELAKSAPASPVEELAAQNQDLFETLEHINVQQSALEQINEELSETNRGVVALYDELDTVHRIGQVVASKLDLDSLLSAITDATTELSGAEFGAFFQVIPGKETLACDVNAGSLKVDCTSLPLPRLSDLVRGLDADVLRFDDAPEQGFPDFFRKLQIRSLLTCFVRNNASELVGVLAFGHTKPCVFTERTERILSTVALQASIGIANANLYRNVQTANDAKDRFLAILSHELRTPLNPVFTILTALEENPEIPPDAKEDLVIMRRNLELEARLIDDLLDLTRIAQGKMPLKFDTVDLHTLIKHVCHTCQSEIDKKKTVIIFALEAAYSLIQGDAGRLQQMLWNLMSNAVKFTPEGGNITLQTFNLSDGQIAFSITDSGRGIEPEALHRVFNPFEQGGNDISSRFGGLGLGLAISKSIIDAHGGEISVRSGGIDKGTNFEVRLPTSERGAAVANLTKATQPQLSVGLRILLVDDHEDTRFITRRMLVIRGHNVVEAASVTEALAKFRGQEFDLLVSDLGLPDGSGHELMVAIQHERPMKGIVLSGYGMETDVAKSKAAGFEEHLTKPINFPLLEAAISRVSSK